MLLQQKSPTLFLCWCLYIYWLYLLPFAWLCFFFFLAFFSVHTLQLLSLLLCFHLPVSPSFPGPLTSSLISLILSLWSLYGADSWQAQLGFSMRAWQTPLLCVCMLMLTVSQRCCARSLCQKRNLSIILTLSSGKLLPFFPPPNALPLRLVIFQCHLNSTSALWDQRKCGKMERTDSNCLFNIEAWLGSLSLQSRKNSLQWCLEQSVPEHCGVSTPFIPSPLHCSR